MKLPDWMALSLPINAVPMANPLGGLMSAVNWMQLNEPNLCFGSGQSRGPALWREIAQR
ncbi:MAG: hypothetical protein VKK97_07875 [Synechococcaceae cyanobacterium]|nr:hypothetical protein [Synechococcaceae cyanobacterium]